MSDLRRWQSWLLGALLALNLWLPGQSAYAEALGMSLWAGGEASADPSLEAVAGDEQEDIADDAGEAEEEPAEDEPEDVGTEDPGQEEGNPEGEDVPQDPLPDDVEPTDDEPEEPVQPTPDDPEVPVPDDPVNPTPEEPTPTEPDPDVPENDEDDPDQQDEDDADDSEATDPDSPQAEDDDEESDQEEPDGEDELEGEEDAKDEEEAEAEEDDIPEELVPQATVDFLDVPRSHWAWGVVRRAAKLGLISGYSGKLAGKFGPEDGITRAQVATILWRMAGKPNPGKSARSFSDVNTGDYFYQAVRWASSRNVVSGYSGDRAGKFGPNDRVTREQLAVMLVNYGKRIAHLNTDGHEDAYSAMSDASRVSSYARTAVGWCFCRGIMTGSNGKIDPQGGATRAQAAKMLVGLYDRAVSTWQLSINAPAATARKGTTVTWYPAVWGSQPKLAYTYHVTYKKWNKEVPSGRHTLSDTGVYQLTVRATDEKGHSQAATSTVTTYALTSFSLTSIGTGRWKASAGIGVPGNKLAGVEYRFTWSKRGSSAHGICRDWSPSPSATVDVDMLGNVAGTFDITVEARDAHGVFGSRSDYVSLSKLGYQNPWPYYQLSAQNVTLPYGDRGIFSYVSPCKISLTSTRRQCIEAFVTRAYEYLGTPYVWDYACAPGVGVDCAGLVLQCLYAVGISPDRYTPYDHYYTPGHDHYAVDMRNDTRFMKVAFKDRQRGDLIFYEGHVAIYLGDDKIIDAVSPATGVDIRSVYSWKVLSCSRVMI